MLIENELKIKQVKCEGCGGTGVRYERYFSIIFADGRVKYKPVTCMHCNGMGTKDFIETKCQ